MANVWYDTKNGIAASLTSLAAFHKLVDARLTAVRERGEKLKEYCVLGLWYLPRTGGAHRIVKSIPKKVMPLVPKVLLSTKAFTTLPGDLSYDPLSGLPPVHVACAACGVRWSIETCHDQRAQYEHAAVPLINYIGCTVAQVRVAFAVRTDGLFVLDENKPIRSDRFIDLRPHPTLHSVQINPRGWGGVPQGVTETYQIRPGDDGNAHIHRFYHFSCKLPTLR